MDTLGDRGRSISDQVAGRQAESSDSTASPFRQDNASDLKIELMRPSLLIRLLEAAQQHEMIVAAVGPPSNPQVDGAQKRLFRDFAAEMADVHPGVDPSDSDLRIDWLQKNLRRCDDEEVIGSALRAWSLSKLVGPSDPYLQAHTVFGLLRDHHRSEDGEGVEASLLLLEKSLRRCLAHASSADDAAFHFVIRATDVDSVFGNVIEAARRAGMPIHDLERRIQSFIDHDASGVSEETPSGGQSADAGNATALSGHGESEPWAQVIDDFDLAAHMASARNMSVLDQVLVRQAIASAIATDGALSVSQLYALIDEVIRLNPNRHQTYYARGFVDAVCGNPISMRFRLANDERRAWVLCGAVMGTLRESDEAAVASLLTEHQGVFDVLLSKPELFAGAWLTEPLYPLLRDQGRFDALSKLFQLHLGNLSRASQKRVVGRVLSDARDLILAGRSERAVDLLDAIGPTLTRPDELAISSLERTSFLQHALWRRGQAAMARGDFGGARSFFGDLRQSQELSRSLEAKVLADVGLAKARIRRIHEVFPSEDEAATNHVLTSLSKGMDEFLKAEDLDRNAAVRSRLCLAVLAIEPRSTADAIPRLRSFLQATMREKPGYYGEYALSWTRFLLALAIMEAGERGDYPNAADEIRDALAVKGFIPPVYMCARLAEAFANAELNEAADLLMAAIEREQPLSLPQVVADRRLERCSGRGRSGLLAYAQQPGLPTEQRLALLARVLDAALRHGDSDALALMAAVVQEIGESDCSACGAHIAFLEEVKRRLAGDELAETFDEAMLALCRVAGQYEPVYARSKKMFEELLKSDDPYDLGYAGEILDDLQELPAPWIHVQVAQLRQRLSEATPSSNLASSISALRRRAAPVRVYVLGGGDRHRSYEASINEKLPERFPPESVEVEFLFPGFSANWMPHVETVKRNIRRFDAIVLIYATRTTFGEWVRDLARRAGIPAYTCGRQGRGAVMHSIAKAVEKCVANDGDV